MTRNAQAKVRAFHEKMGLPVGDESKPAISQYHLRWALIDEELGEFYDACHHDRLNLAADALADLLYVVLGSAVEFGIDLEPVFDEVHRSNMTKTPGNVNEAGKLMKGPGYEPPDIESVLARQRGRK